MTTLTRTLVFMLLAAVAGLVLPGVAHAEDPVQATVTNIENKFPDEVIFSVQAESSAASVRTVTLRLVVGSGTLERLGTVDITPGRTVQGKYTLKTGGNNFIAPGADITYWLEAEDTSGNKTQTPKQTLWYADTRFDWRKAEDGSVTVYYYRNSEGLARDLLAAARQTEDKVGGMLGTKGRPFRVMLYNNPPDLIGAQRPETSEKRAQEILRVGVAYSGEDLVQVLASGTLGAQDTARHEIAHLFVNWSAGSNVPTWLNEGMAVWSQNDPGREYLGSLERAIRNDSLLLLRGLDSFPGKSDETILAYGESYSVVKYLVDTYGGGKMRQLFEAMKGGEGASAGLQRVYGLNVDEIDARWRQSVGAKARASYETSVPTPVTLGEIQSIDSPVQAPGGQTLPAAGQQGQQLPPFMLALIAAGAALLLLVGGAAVFTLARRRP